MSSRVVSWIRRWCVTGVVGAGLVAGSTVPAAQAAPASSTLRVVVLGDSVPAGSACHCTPFGERVAATIGARQGRPVRTQNFARADDTEDTLARLRTTRVRSAVGASELTIVQVGANNFSSGSLAACRNRIEDCYGPDLRWMRTDVTRILRTVYALQRNSKAEVVVVGYWNLFPDGPVGRARGSRWMLGADRLTRAANDKLRESARASGALYVDGYTPFKGGGSARPDAFLARDGDHPNAAGHRVLARATLRRLGSLTRTL